MLSAEDLESLKDTLFSYRMAEDLPSEDSLVRLLDDAISSLESEDHGYRPVADDGTAGGLLDFRGGTVPVIIVPDLHARPTFLLNVLQCSLGGQTVLEALNEGAVIVLCVGDGVHTENLTWAYKRWKQALDEWERGVIDSESMRQEMRDGFATMMVVWQLKTHFPASFHFLKGNHENVLNMEGGGDHPFRKFAYEGEMVREFIRTVYSDVVLHLIHCFERSLPVVAIFQNFGVSHAEPRTAYSRHDIINYHGNDELILDFTWTGNDQACEGSVAAQFAQLQDAAAGGTVLWFGGHRPVAGSCKLRQDGRYVQIHNPDAMNVVFAIPGTDFDPQRDIISVIKKEGV